MERSDFCYFTLSALPQGEDYLRHIHTLYLGAPWDVQVDWHRVQGIPFEEGEDLTVCKGFCSSLYFSPDFKLFLGVLLQNLSPY